MQVMKKTIILGIVVFLIVWTVLLIIGPVVGSASDYSATPPTLISPANDAWVAEDKPTFKWRAPDDNQSGFNLQISNEINFVTPVQNITEKSSTQNYTLTTALDDGMYYWRVETNDTSGVWSLWSIPRLVKIDTTPPNPVTDVSLKVLSKFKITQRALSGMKIGGQLIKLTWTKSGDPYFLRYEIYVSTDPSVIGTRTATIATPTTTYYDQVQIGSKGSENLLKGILDPDTTYYFSVVVVDRAELSSDWEAATVSQTTNVPLNWLLIGGIAIAVEVAIVAIFVVIKLFIKKE